jgi:hypothetical protein
VFEVGFTLNIPYYLVQQIRDSKENAVEPRGELRKLSD